MNRTLCNCNTYPRKAIVEVIMRKSYQFRIYPTKNQEVKLNSTLSICRHLYNDSLDERKRQSELNNLCRSFDVFPWGKPEWITYRDQQNALPKYKTQFQKEVHSQVLQNTLKRVDRSFKNFFNGFGYPRFQGRDRYNSFTYTQSGFELENEKLTLSKIGNIKIIQHRGIEGKHIEPPEFLRVSEKRLTREQIKLSRKKKRSNNRAKQRIKVAKVHRTIRNQREDFAHKTSKILVDTYDKIVFEDLQIQNMVQNHHLAKSISDAGWSQMIQFTTYKAEYAGKIVELVNPRDTSQNCSSCGTKVPKSLSMRVHKCPNCGLVLDRDHNAAINILQRSKNTVGTAGIKACPSSLSIDTMKQEAPSEMAG
ncbi:MAG: transposase [Candidatus Methanoperedens sp.]